MNRPDLLRLLAHAEEQADRWFRTAWVRGRAGDDEGASEAARFANRYQREAEQLARQVRVRLLP